MLKKRAKESTCSIPSWFKLESKVLLELGMVVHVCDPSTWEAEAGGS
jgi:hypothetical protein